MSVVPFCVFRTTKTRDEPNGCSKAGPCRAHVPGPEISSQIKIATVEIASWRFAVEGREQVPSGPPPTKYQVRSSMSEACGEGGGGSEVRMSMGLGTWDAKKGRWKVKTTTPSS
jgi:hypothetical protein